MHDNIFLDLMAGDSELLLVINSQDEKLKKKDDFLGEIFERKDGMCSYMQVASLASVLYPDGTRLDSTFKENSKNYIFKIIDKKRIEGRNPVISGKAYAYELKSNSFSEIGEDVIVRIKNVLGYKVPATLKS
ncbi:MAG: hypothetical protein PHC66_01930 [Candidatus Nanoarchaeia archaeon]|nr:hypothetical protein [Candidatus Nanoarchaeia archaeon]MDD5239047.1 hypothetical protein [Candidatus Nanoarchaeia archaeon]